MNRLLLILGLFVAACAPPKRNTPLAEIPTLTKLEDVMDNQATVADPLFKRVGQAAYTDAEFAAFADAAVRLQATALKTKDFSKGPAFDALALRVADKARSLGDAAQAKDGASSSKALAEMKATCKECHSKFRR